MKTSIGGWQERIRRNVASLFGPATKASPAAPVVNRASAAPGHSTVDLFERSAAAPAPRPLSEPFLAKDRPYSESDGRLYGADGRSYDPATPLAHVPAVEPKNGGATGTILYLNGINTTTEIVDGDMRQIADATGQRVIGIYNGTDGLGADVLQAAGDTLDLDNGNKAVATTAKLILEQLERGETVQILAHSQGALIASRALYDVRAQLLAGGRSEEQVEAVMGRLVIETHGGAAPSYPDGPAYTHYINTVDAVPGLFGLGRKAIADLGISDAGKGAKIVEFTDGNLAQLLNPVGDDHLLGTYLRHRE